MSALLTLPTLVPLVPPLDAQDKEEADLKKKKNTSRCTDRIFVPKPER